VRDEDWYGPNDGKALVLFYIRYTAGARGPGSLFRFMKKGAWMGGREIEKRENN